MAQIADELVTAASAAVGSVRKPSTWGPILGEQAHRSLSRQSLTPRFDSTSGIPAGGFGRCTTITWPIPGPTSCSAAFDLRPRWIMVFTHQNLENRAFMNLQEARRLSFCVAKMFRISPVT